MTNADLAIALMEVAIGVAGLALGYIVGLHQGRQSERAAIERLNDPFGIGGNQ